MIIIFESDFFEERKCPFLSVKDRTKMKFKHDVNSSYQGVSCNHIPFENNHLI